VSLVGRRSETEEGTGSDCARAAAPRCFTGRPSAFSGFRDRLPAYVVPCMNDVWVIYKETPVSIISVLQLDTCLRYLGLGLYVY
jgi:hypothetical protein